MFKNRRSIRVIAMFLLINLLQWTFAETAIALTSGPTAPEYTSFEPFDVTDMVNPQSGDFTYNVPLLNIPSPEGGYPLSMSYHAGIMPNEDASWVGLGWTLNTGAINRMVNNYPDDNTGDTRIIRDYWEGGVRKTFKVGVGYGFDVGSVNLSVGPSLEFSNDTYKGFGVGGSVNASVGIKDSPYNANAGIGISPYGQIYASGGIGFMDNKSSIGLSVGVATNFESVGGYTNVMTKHGNGVQSSLGVSMSSNGLKPNWSIGGYNASTNNNNIGKITTSSMSMGIFIPVFPLVNISLSYNYLRYFSDETDGVQTYGSLNFRNALIADVAENRSTNNNALDSYALGAEKPSEIVDNPEPDWLVSGSFPAYDNYSVTAQGISGSIQPYLFENGSLFRSNVLRLGDKDNRTDDDFFYTRFLSLQPFGREVSFRFKNDFSNSYSSNFSTIDQNLNLNDSQDKVKNYGYNNVKQHLEGSKHVEWYTNDDLNVPNSRVITPENYVYDSNIGSKIGGFVITNESGMTYHFTQPVYASDNYSYNGFYDERGKLIKRETWNPEKHAYTWLLVAITGPDYVDRNNDNKVDESDWGYWVGFEHGKWSDSYRWRNPGIGTKKDIDGKTDNFATGIKEIYYLDAIRTRTHTALFVKEMKNDGKSATDIFLGGYFSFLNSLNVLHFYSQNPELDYMFFDRLVHYNHPNSTLKLNSIFLLKNSDYQSLNLNKSDGQMYETDIVYSNWTSNIAFFPDNMNVLTSIELNEKLYNNQSFPEAIYNNDVSDFVIHKKNHYGDNVLDIDDISSIATELNQIALRKIDFNTDYSLCENTANSFDNSNNYVQIPQTNLPLTGKLTLNSIDFKGIGGEETMPSIEFEYELDSEDQKNGKLTVTTYPSQGGNLSSNTGMVYIANNTGIVVGDIVKFTINTKVFYGTILNNPDGNNYTIRYVGNALPTASELNLTVDCVTTKNPPYNTQAYDDWNMYKSDYQSDVVYNSSRRTTEISSKSVDVWSLRTIRNSLGSKMKIEYESDSYSDIVASPRTFSYPVQASIVDGYVQLDLKGGIIEDDVLQAMKLGKVDIDVLLLAEWSFEYSDNVGKSASVKKAYEIQGQEEMGCGTKWADFEYQNDIGVKADYADKTKIRLISSKLSTLINKQYGKVDLKIRKCGSTGFRQLEEETVGIPNQVTGNLLISSEEFDNYGGGIRVKNTNVVSSGAEIYIQSYNYSTPTNVSSGITSYVPYTLHQPAYELDATNYYSGSDEVNEGYYNNVMIDKGKPFVRDLYSYYDEIYNLNRIIPAPGVMYEYVTVQENANGVDMYGKRRYQFEVFNRNMVENVKLYRPPYISGTDVDIDRATVAIKDFTSRIGNILTVQTLDDNNQLVESVENQYLHHNDNGTTKISGQFENELKSKFDNQGVVQQEFNEYRIKRTHLEGKEWHKAVVSRLEEYPNVLLSTKHYRDGVTTITTNNQFDYYSGAVTKSTIENNEGLKYESVTIPAYRKYSGMGLKVNNPNNSHMISQSTGSYLMDANKTITNYYGYHNIQNLGNDIYRVSINQILPDVTSALRNITLVGHGEAKVVETTVGLGKTVIVFEFSQNISSSGIEFQTHPLLEASIQTWNNNWEYREFQGGNFVDVYPTASNEKIWRKHANYTYSGKLGEEGVFEDMEEFDWYSPNASNKWKYMGENTRYNRYSHPIESRDLNGKYHSVIYDGLGMQVQASSSFSTFNGFFHTSFENPGDYNGNTYFSGEIKNNAGNQSIVLESQNNPIKAHTGDAYMSLQANEIGPEYKCEFPSSPISTIGNINKGKGLEKGKTYRASVWVHDLSPDDAKIEISLTALTSQVAYNNHIINMSKNDMNAKKVGDWWLLEKDFWIDDIFERTNIGSAQVKVYLKGGQTGASYFDDFRLKPLEAVTGGYVYDYYSGQLTHILDNENMYTRYEYDHAGKLKAIYRETPEDASGEKLVSKSFYNYAN